MILLFMLTSFCIPFDQDQNSPMVDNQRRQNIFANLSMSPQNQAELDAKKASLDHKLNWEFWSMNTATSSTPLYSPIQKRKK